MSKYSIKAFDDVGDLVFSAIVPFDTIFDFINSFKDDFTLKAYVIDDEEKTISNV